MEGDKKYSPPRGTTKSCLGRASDAVRLLGSVPPIDLGSLTFCPIYILLRLENGEKNNKYTYNCIEAVVCAREVCIVRP